MYSIQANLPHAPKTQLTFWTVLSKWQVHSKVFLWQRLQTDTSGNTVAEIELIRRDTEENKKSEDTYRIEVQSVSRFLVLIHP